MTPAVVPTTKAAPIARGGAGRLPPMRSATTCFRKGLISSPSPHQCEERRLPLDPAPERFLELERPLDPRREDEGLDLLRELEPLRPLVELELPLDEACFCFDALWLLRFCGWEPLTTSPSWMVPRQAPVSTSCISTKALKRARSARTARFTWRIPRAIFSIHEPGSTSRES